MPTLRPRKRASASSSSARRSEPATCDRAGVGALQPGHHHQQRGLARAGGPDQANRLAAPYMQIDVLEDMNTGRAAAERKIDPGECNRRALRHRGVVHVVQNPGVRSRSCAPLIWDGARSGPAARRGLHGAAGLSRARRSAADQPVKIVALGDSLIAGYQLPAGDAFPVRLERALRAQGRRGRDRQCRRLRRHQLGRAGAARLVGAGGHRRGDPGAWRERHAARRRSEGDARGARRDRPPAEGAPHRGAAVRHAGAAESRAGLRARVQSDLSGARRRRMACCSIRFSSTASPPTPSLNQRDGMHPNADGVAAIVERILPKVEELIARVRANRGS